MFGFAYKKNTSDTRESPAISVVRSLVAEQSHVAIYDPQVTSEHIHEELEIAGCLEHEKYVTVSATPYDAAEDAHAVVILTEWDEFSNKSKGDQAPSSPSPSTEAEDSAVEFGIKDAREDSVVEAAIQLPKDCRVNWTRVWGLMQKPSTIFDGRRVVDVEKLEAIGFRVESIGRGSII